MSRKQCILQGSDITLQQVENFKYLLEVVFIRKTKLNWETDKRIGKANVVLHELHHSEDTMRTFKHCKAVRV